MKYNSALQRVLGIALTLCMILATAVPVMAALPEAASAEVEGAAAEIEAPQDDLYVSVSAAGTVNGNYAFFSGTQGEATGVVTLSTTAPDSDFDGYTLYWGNEKGALEGYQFIRKLTRTGSKTRYEMPARMLIPKGVTRLLIYPTKGEMELTSISAVIELPDYKKPTGEGEPLFTFMQISDIHAGDGTAEAHQRIAYQDQRSNEKVAAITVAGDLTTGGTEGQYTTLRNLLNEFPELPPIYFAPGNHDIGNDYANKSARFMNFIGEEKIYHKKTIGGLPFLFLGSSEQTGLGGKLGTEQLAWIKEQIMESDISKPIFLINHQTVQSTVAGSYPGEWGGRENAKLFDGEELQAIIEQYPNVVYISGHTHARISGGKTLYTRGLEHPYYLNDGAIQYLQPENAPDPEVNDSGAQGFYIDVYADKLVLCGKDFSSASKVEWIPTAYLKAPLYTNMAVELTGLEANAEYSVYVPGKNAETKTADAAGRLSVNVLPGSQTVRAEKGTSAKVYTIEDHRVVSVKEEQAAVRLDIGKGPITIGDNTVHGYDSNGTEISTPSQGGYRIQGTSTTNTVTVNGGTNSIILDNLNINAADSAIAIRGSATVNMRLEGENNLTVTGGKAVRRAAIEVLENNTLVIDGTYSDSLTASGGGYSAGIGGIQKFSAGKITVNGGRITATGGTGWRYGAGIGGGEGGGAQLITINGGSVTAHGGYGHYEGGTGEGGISYADGWGSGAGIGGGGGETYKGEAYMKSSIVVNGGSVFAYGAVTAGETTDNSNKTLHGSGLGNGTGNTIRTAESDVKINGGSVFTSPTQAAAVTGDGQTRYRVKIAGLQPNREMLLKTDVGTWQVYTGDDGSLYAYLPKGKTTVYAGETKAEGTVLEDGTGELSHEQVFDIGKGPLILTESAAEGYDKNGVQVSASGTMFRVVGSSTTNTITVEGGRARTLILDNVNIQSSANSAIAITGGAIISLNLTGETTLKTSVRKKAVLSVAENSMLTINGTDQDRLNVIQSGNYAAAIGGDVGQTAGSITVNGGEINAKVVNNYGAGIGGGEGGGARIITINGGFITAVGGNGHRDGWGAAAGIGGGGGEAYNGLDYTASKIVVNGGSIFATGGFCPAVERNPSILAKPTYHGTGIGNGTGCKEIEPSAADVTINGGAVMSASDMFSSKDSSGQILYRATVENLKPNQIMQVGLQMDISGVGKTKVKTDSSGYLNFYLPEGQGMVSIDGAAASGTVTADGMAVLSKEDILDIGQGSIEIGDGTVNGFNSMGVPITTPNKAGYIIAGTSKTNTVTITGGIHNIRLNNASIETEGSAIAVKNTSIVRLTVSGQNVVSSSREGAAALCVEAGASLTIKGTNDDTLNAAAKGGKAAGIGGAANSMSGKITIDGGRISAVSEGLYGAGIGGGAGGGAAQITINGGVINAAGGNGGSGWGAAAGIGGGGGQPAAGAASMASRITVNGGSVTAEGGAASGTIANAGALHGGGLGDGHGGAAEILIAAADVIVNGGSLVTTPEQVSYNDSEQTKVYRAKVTDLTANQEVTVQDPRGSWKASVDEAGCLYPYLPEGAADVTISGMELTGTVLTDGSTVLSHDLAFDIGRGPIELGADTISAYDTAGNHITTSRSGVNIIVGTSDTNTISVTGGTHRIRLENVKIHTPGSAIRLTGGASLDLTISGTNELSSTGNVAALSVPENTELTVNGTNRDVLEVSALGKFVAAIGGDKKLSAGTITINGGKITADSHARDYGAGIGGGEGGGAQLITINGGIITALGGNAPHPDGWGAAAGIGGGGGELYKGADYMKSTIVVNGGTIKASGGVTPGTSSIKADQTSHGSGLGNGTGNVIQTAVCSVKINGGSLLVSPAEANYLNGSGTPQYKTRIAGLEANKLVTVSSGNSSWSATTDGSGNLYAYLPATAVVLQADNKVYQGTIAANDRNVLGASAVQYQLIDEAPINIAAPQAGDATASATSISKQFSVSRTEWTTAEGTPVTGTFGYNTSYKAAVTLTAEDGYRFDADTKILDYAVRNLQVGGGGATLTFEVIFEPTGVAQIASVPILINGPVGGMTPADARTESQECTVSQTVWTDESGVPVDGSFDYGTVYKSVVTLSAIEGYLFTEATTVSGIAISDLQIGSNGATLTVRTTFDATAEKPGEDTTKITEAVVTVTAPVTGAAPEKATAESNEFQVRETQWKTADGSSAGPVFKGETVYKVTIMLEAAEGYMFTSNSTVKGVNATNLKVLGEGNVLSFEVTFPATGESAEKVQARETANEMLAALEEYQDKAAITDDAAAAQVKQKIEETVLAINTYLQHGGTSGDLTGYGYLAGAQKAVAAYEADKMDLTQLAATAEAALAELSQYQTEESIADDSVKLEVEGLIAAADAKIAALVEKGGAAESLTGYEFLQGAKDAVAAFGKPKGAAISGTVELTAGDAGKATVVLTKTELADASEAYGYEADPENGDYLVEVTADEPGGSTGTYTIEGVAPGEYTLLIRKPGALYYQLNKLIVEQEAIAFEEAVILPVGDLDLDGYINASDLGVIINVANYDKAEEEAANAAADLDGDGYINAADIGVLINLRSYDKEAEVATYQK